MGPNSRWLALVVGLVVVFSTLFGVTDTARADDRETARLARMRDDYAKKKRKVLVESGHRHLELGVWCRDKGLVSQASMEFIRAVEVSEHRHPGAQKVLGIMRSLGDDFWKSRRRTRHTGLLEQYEKRTAKATERAEKDRFKLAEWAWDKGLVEEGEAEFRRLVELADAPLEVDRSGCIELPAGELPEDLSAKLIDEAVTINGRQWLRDRFLACIPDVAEVHEVETERVRVRSMISKAQAETVMRGCMALLPLLTADTGGRPTERMTVFVFADTDTYEAFLEATDRSSHRKAAGLALGGENLALVNADGRDDEAALGIALHEVSHLFMYGITRSMMPSWYSEGFAETYGGQGCYHWTDGELTAHGVMAKHRLGGLTTDAGYIPLVDLFAGNALDHINADKRKAANFYAQSWAFVRFLRRGAGEEIAERFERWEDMCRGKALGAVFDKPAELGDARPSQQLFDELFGPDLERLEGEFREYLKTL